MKTRMLASYTVDAGVIKARSWEGVAAELARRISNRFLEEMDKAPLNDNEEITVSILRFPKQAAIAKAEGPESV